MRATTPLQSRSNNLFTLLSRNLTNEVQRLISENETLRNRIKTEIPNLEKEKFELEMKLSKVQYLLLNFGRTR